MYFVIIRKFSIYKDIFFILYINFKKSCCIKFFLCRMIGDKVRYERVVRYKMLFIIKKISYRD